MRDASQPADQMKREWRIHQVEVTGRLAIEWRAAGGRLLKVGILTLAGAIARRNIRDRKPNQGQQKDGEYAEGHGPGGSGNRYRHFRAIRPSLVYSACDLLGFNFELFRDCAHRTTVGLLSFH